MNSHILDVLLASNKTELSVLEAMFDVEPYRSGEVIPLPGSGALDTLALLSKGNIEVKIPHGVGESIICMIYPADMIELNTFVAHTAHKARLYAVGETNILCMSKSKLESMSKSHPLVMYRVAQGIMHNYQNILGRMGSRIAELSDYIYHTNSRI